VILKIKPDPRYIGVPNICFSLLDASDDRHEKYADQRRERGFDDYETWSLTDTFAKFMLPRLARFRELYAEFIVVDKAWSKDMYAIKKALELLICDNGSWIFSGVEMKEVDAGLKALSKRFQQLWW
jgi:hypothetical protein